MLVFRTVAIPNNSDAREDGLYFDEVGNWADVKHEIVYRYGSEFSTAMKYKWDCRVYIDLYSGPGLLRIRGTNRFIWGSAIHALSVKDPFDKYIMCDQNPEALHALEARVRRKFPGTDVAFVSGSCDEKIKDICDKIPRYSRGHKVLSFCFVD